jgi:hypothetical protein
LARTATADIVDAHVASRTSRMRLTSPAAAVSGHARCDATTGAHGHADLSSIRCSAFGEEVLMEFGLKVEPPKVDPPKVDPPKVDPVKPK